MSKREQGSTMRSIRFPAALGVLGVLGAHSFAPATTPGAWAQEPPSSRSWQLALWAHTGYLHPIGPFARSSPPDQPGRTPIDSNAEFGASQILGTGLEIGLPGTENFTFRAEWERTTGAQAKGSLIICDILDGSLCRPEVAPATISGILVEARSSRADPRGRFTPILGIGFGLRWYEFSVPDCDGRSGDGKLVCGAITDLYRDPRRHFVLRLGAGIRKNLGRLLTELWASAGTGLYAGGTDPKITGLWYHDVRFNVAVGTPIF